MEVKSKMVVSIRYRMRNSKGEVLEDIKESPIT
jgi:FKBP-type peptidyl-prolyl cis-trans isomerase 2